MSLEVEAAGAGRLRASKERLTSFGLEPTVAANSFGVFFYVQGLPVLRKDELDGIRKMGLSIGLEP